MSGQAKRGRDWYALATDWYRDPVLRAVAREAPVAFALWPVLCALAHDCSHHEDNPTGAFKTAWVDLAESIGATEDQIGAVMDLFVEGEMLTYEQNRLGVPTVTLAQYRKWNAPRRGAAERSREWRHRKAFAGVLPDSDTVPNDHATAANAHNTTQHNTTQKKETPGASSGPRDTDITIVLESWQQTWGKQRSAITGPKAKKRRTRVSSRFREGWTRDELITAVKGWRNDPWDGRINACGVEHLLRDSAQVERGIELFSGGPAGVAAKPERPTLPDCEVCDNTRYVEVPGTDGMTRCECAGGASNG